ncbi:hypothetical protein AK812_SmicGene37017 [Symbiodinium microadriaticum]|uniref:Uncharacterized protein n=1 Tax=Symbiodinium microadriaticum TaxID=2951 RepID=A0A1Q9CHJ1_SYMMI|nr:hypothetical protein AK812_SmicGene37017 [Symbiodinium microadriaticum]CAE7562942.1 unnamed protein product [Symbiodinium microadriaticum]
MSRLMHSWVLALCSARAQAPSTPRQATGFLMPCQHQEYQEACRSSAAADDWAELLTLMEEDELEESTSRQKEARTNTVRWSWLHVLVMSVALLGLCILMGIVMDNMRSSGRDGAEARLALWPEPLWSNPCAGSMQVSGLGTVPLINAKYNLPSDPAGNVWMEDAAVVIADKGRTYWGTSCNASGHDENFDPSGYIELHLLGKRLEYTTHINGVGCGCNAALYLVSMSTSPWESACEVADLNDAASAANLLQQDRSESDDIDVEDQASLQRCESHGAPEVLASVGGCVHFDEIFAALRVQAGATPTREQTATVPLGAATVDGRGKAPPDALIPSTTLLVMTEASTSTGPAVIHQVTTATAEQFSTLDRRFRLCLPVSFFWVAAVERLESWEMPAVTPTRPRFPTITHAAQDPDGAAGRVGGGGGGPSSLWRLACGDLAEIRRKKEAGQFPPERPHGATTETDYWFVPANDYYCDAMSICGVQCHEIDLQEANMHAFHSTLHDLESETAPSLGTGGGGDTYTGPRNFGSTQYGDGSNCIDTSEKFRVSVEFPVHEGTEELKSIDITLSQNGCSLRSSASKFKDSLDILSKVLKKGMTPVMSYWRDANMMWLDGNGPDEVDYCTEDMDSNSTCASTVTFTDFALSTLEPRIEIDEPVLYIGRRLVEQLYFPPLHNTPPQLQALRTVATRSQLQLPVPCTPGFGGHVAFGNGRLFEPLPADSNLDANSEVGARPHQKMQSENAEEGVHLCQGEQEEEK